MTSEKEEETLDLLLTTPVSADQIVTGKLVSGLFYFLLLELTSLPVLLLCFVLGGLSVGDVLGLYGYLFLQLVIYGLTSIVCSAYFHRTHLSVILSYVLVGMEAVVMSAAYGDGLAFAAGDWVGFLVVGSMLVVLLYGAARQGVRRPYSPVRKSIEEEDPSKTVGLVIRRDHYPEKLIIPSRRQGLLQDGVNPVLDKELQTEITGSGSLFIKLVIQLGLLASVGTFVWVLSAAVRQDALRSGHPEYGYFCFILGYIMILGPSLAATTFTNEKEHGTLESLVLSLIPRSRIVWGKFLSIARVVGALAFLNCWGFIMIVLVSSQQFSQLPAMAIVGLTSIAFTTALGMSLSLLCRRSLTAMISTYFIIFALFIGPVLLETLLTRFFPDVSEQSFAFLAYLSPFLSSHMPRGGRGVYFEVLLTQGLIFVALTAGMLGLMSHYMERILQRQAHTR